MSAETAGYSKKESCAASAKHHPIISPFFLGEK